MRKNCLPINEPIPKIVTISCKCFFSWDFCSLLKLTSFDMKPCWRLCFAPALLGKMQQSNLDNSQGTQTLSFAALAQATTSYHKALESSLVFLSGDFRCALVPQPPQQGLLHTFGEKRQVILFDVVPRWSSTWAAFLRSHTFCAMVHVKTNITNLLGVVELLRKVPRSHVVFTSHQKPRRENLLRHRRKLYWADETQKVIFIIFIFFPFIFCLCLVMCSMYHLQNILVVHSFCPKVGRPRTRALTKVAVCSRSNCIFPRPKNTLPYCRNTVEGQQIKVAIGPGLPATILPMVFGKSLAGYNVRMHQALGRVLNFQPELIFPLAGAGVYNNKTKSFTHNYRELVKQVQMH